MMPDPGGWFARWSQKLISLLTKREVKTPLAFYFRCIWALLVIVIAALWFGAPNEHGRFFSIGIGFLVFLVVVVSIFAWWRPKNLVYGETGHRAEYKLGLGTATQEMTSAEVEALPGSPN